MIGIIGAMNEEIDVIKSHIDQLVEKEIAKIKFYTGKIHQKEVVLVQSGIGKVNAAISTTLLLEHYHPDYIINIGTAGGVKNNCNVLDIVISEQVGYHDVDVTSFNYEIGQIPHMPVFFESDEQLIRASIDIFQKEKLPFHRGLIVSGDAFISDKKQISKIKNDFSDVIAVEMEACAIAHVCYIYNKPFIIIRSLSDIAGRESHLSFDQYLEKASLQSSNYVLKLIEKFELKK